MNDLLFTITSITFYGSLFLHLHFVLRYTGNNYTSAKNIQYRYLQMAPAFFLFIVLYLTRALKNFDIFALSLLFSAWYYALRFGVFYRLRWLVLCLLLGLGFWNFPQESIYVAVLAGVGLSYLIDAIWNRELKKRVLP